MYRVTIEEITPYLTEKPGESEKTAGETVVERFRQTVDTLDVQRVVALINTKPRARRTVKSKTEAK